MKLAETIPAPVKLEETAPTVEVYDLEDVSFGAGMDLDGFLVP